MVFIGIAAGIFGIGFIIHLAVKGNKVLNADQKTFDRWDRMKNQ